MKRVKVKSSSRRGSGFVAKISTHTCRPLGLCSYHSGKNKRGNKGVNTVPIHKNMYHVFTRYDTEHTFIVLYSWELKAENIDVLGQYANLFLMEMM